MKSPTFYRNLGLLAAALVVSLLVGFWGYQYFAEQTPIDAFLNSSMILSGMGPVDPILTESGKIFAGCYALYSGVFFLVIFAYILDQVIWRNA